MEAKNYRILTINNIAQKALDSLKDNYLISDDEENPHGIIVRSADLHDYEISNDLMYIGRAGSGVNNIPIDKCSENGVLVCNAAGGNANAVKELLIASLIFTSRNIVDGIEWVKTLEGNEDIAGDVEAGKKAFKGPEIKGKNLAIIGLGHIGQLVADAAISLGLNVYGIDPYLTVEDAIHLNEKIEYVDDLEKLVSLADYISIHIPYSEENKNYINENLIEKMKDGVKIFNLARSGLVDNKAVAKALDSGKVAHYLVDFPDNETIKMKNTINLPHLGASTPESEEVSAQMVIDAMTDYFENGNIKNSVNFPDCNMGLCTSKQRIVVMHRNIANMIKEIVSVLSEDNINVANLLNSNRGEWAYTMVDIDEEIRPEQAKKIGEIESVVRVRIL